MKSNKVALITGSARRIGAIIARHLHDAGFNVMIHCRHSIEDAKALSDSLNVLRPESACVFKADLSQNTQLQAMCEAVKSQWGRLDLLVNNASSFYKTPLAECDESNWDDLMASNVKGAFFLSKYSADMLAHSEGSIINIVDIYSQKPLKRYPIYCMAKAALLMMTKSLALELAPKVRVNSISPGSTLWPEGENSVDANKKAELLEKTMLRRQANPNDIAKSVLFLAQNNSITAQNINVDSGRSQK